MKLIQSNKNKVQTARNNCISVQPSFIPKIMPQAV
jgi:hypothetical protein